MSGFQQKIGNNAKRKAKVQCEEAKQASEPDSDMAYILKLSNREFKIHIINMLRV